MASSIHPAIPPTVSGGHYVVTILNPQGVVYTPRFRNVLPSGYADLPTYQTACQAAAIALVDSTLAKGPNATAAVASLR